MSDGPTVTPGSLLVLAPKRRVGRPPLAEPTASVSARLRPGDHDRVIAEANRRGVSVASLVRAAVLRAIRPPGA